MRNSNGFGSVIKLGGKRRRPYAVRITAGWTEDGRQIFKYLSYHAKKTDAKNALAEYNRNPYNLDLSKLTFAEIYERWSEREFKSLSESSVKGYRSAYKHCESIYGVVFRDLRKTHLQTVLDSIEAPSAAEMVKFLFHKSYKYALENDIVMKDYSQFVTLPKKKPSKKKVPFTRDEVNFLWENVDKIAYADFVLILLYTGMRIGELLIMTKSDIHLDERYMIGGLKTEAGKERLIPIHKRIVPLLENRISEKEWLFSNKRGGQLKYSPFIKHHWSKLIKEIGAEHTPHDTRHFFISEMDRLGVNRVTVQKIVGHSDRSVTEHYTHKTVAELLDAVDKLE